MTAKKHELVLFELLKSYMGKKRDGMDILNTAFNQGRSYQNNKIKEDIKNLFYTHDIIVPQREIDNIFQLESGLKLK